MGTAPKGLQTHQVGAPESEQERFHSTFLPESWQNHMPSVEPSALPSLTESELTLPLLSPSHRDSSPLPSGLSLNSVWL